MAEYISRDIKSPAETPGKNKISRRLEMMNSRGLLIGVVAMHIIQIEPF